MYNMVNCFALLSLIITQASAATCTPTQCSLNGDCNSVGDCVCDPAWKGKTCSQLNLLPLDETKVVNGVYKPKKHRTSWGANVLQSSEDHLYHMFVAEMKSNCTLTSWIPNSQIVHATSTTLDGPYVYKNIVFDTFHHNPRLIQNPQDGSYLLYMIGGPHSGSSSVGGECKPLPPAEGELLDTRIMVSRATSLNGPWSTPIGPLIERGAANEWDYVVTNPTPIILKNGTTLLYYRGTPKYWKDGKDGQDGDEDGSNSTNAPLDLPESVGIAVAPSWKGPYKKIFTQPILKVMNEDPFAWQNKRGFHMLTHGRNDWWNTHHSYSKDGLSWSDGADIATDPNITMTNGKIYQFTNRERPQIYFNESTGEPAMLFNGVCPGKKYTYAYTFAQQINQQRSTKTVEEMATVDTIQPNTTTPTKTITKTTLLPSATTIDVTIPNLGTVRGLSFKNYNAFLDIPYGQTTAGDNRWRAPLAYPSWGETMLDATQARDGCTGANSGGDPIGPDTQSYSENCLNLRIWTPPTANNQTSSYPVLVWLHGGGYMYGTTGDPMYDGRFYAQNHNVILVTLNYRLGALGYLGTPNSGGDAKYDLSGNYGIMDQQLALRWVQDHIASFGGDKNRVLLFGQSAGAMSVICHLTSPLSTGLFHAAEIRSPVGLHYRTKAESAKHAATLATALGCFPLGKGIVPCMRSKSADDIVKNQLIGEYIHHLTDPTHGINFLEWIPSIDGIVLLDEPHNTIVNNQTWNRVPLIIGSMRNETDAWIPNALTETEYKLLFDAAMRIQWGKEASSKVASVYSNDLWFESIGLASTDWLMTCYVRRLALAASKQQVPTFMYQFLHYNSPGADPTNAMQPAPAHPACVDGRAACHAGDNMFTMGTVSLIPNGTFTAIEENISNGIMSTTSRMAEMIGKSKDALSNAVLPLVLYNDTKQQSVAWGGLKDSITGEERVSTVIEKFRSKFCDFWDTMTPADAVSGV